MQHIRPATESGSKTIDTEPLVRAVDSPSTAKLYAVQVWMQ